jgi:hypothetical protein
MVRRAYKLQRGEQSKAADPVNRRDVISIRETLEELTIARCPLCKAMLIARMSRGGPKFFCRCPLKALKRAA